MGDSVGFNPSCPSTSGAADVITRPSSTPSKRKFATKDCCTSSYIPDTGLSSMSRVAANTSLILSYNGSFGSSLYTESLSYSVPST